MADFGLLDSGFVRKRLDEIKAEMETDFRELFGDIDVAPASVFGQIIGSVSERISDLWEILEAIYYSQYPHSAEGVSLDNAVNLSGTVRLKSTKTKAFAVVFTGNQPAAPGSGEVLLTVPAGNIVSVPETGTLFELASDVDIRDTNQLRSIVGVSLSENGIVYSITINASTFSYTATGADVEASIADELAIAINAGSEPVAAVNNADGTLTITTTDEDRLLPFSIVASNTGAGEKIKVNEYGSPAIYFAQNAGLVELVSGTMNTIETPISGFSSVTNIRSGITGTDPESDASLRARHERDLKIIGAGTVESIRARLLQEVPSVSQVFVKENRTSIDNTGTGGLPPHSINVIVSGGDDNAVAQKIWSIKPAGIETYGSDFGSAIDSEGTIQRMYFDRPETRFVYMHVTLTRNTEAPFPTNGIEAIKANLEAYGNALQVGADLIIQSFFGPIFSVQGIASAVIQWAEVGEFDPAPSYPADFVSTNISIAPSKIARFAIARITIPTPV